jgi:hypothetical protein
MTPKLASPAALPQQLVDESPAKSQAGDTSYLEQESFLNSYPASEHGDAKDTSLSSVDVTAVLVDMPAPEQLTFSQMMERVRLNAETMMADNLEMPTGKDALMVMLETHGKDALMVMLETQCYQKVNEQEKSDC